MGEPATPSQKEREETRALARSIVESVRNDEVMPHGLIAGPPRAEVAVYLSDVEQIVFQLAQEIVLLHDVIEAHKEALRG